MSDVLAKDNMDTPKSAKTDKGDISVVAESTGANPEVKERETIDSTSQRKQGDLQLFPVSVKTHNGKSLSYN